MLSGLVNPFKPVSKPFRNSSLFGSFKINSFPTKTKEGYIIIVA